MTISGLALLLIVAVAATAAQAAYQDQIYRARDRVLPALIHIQPVIIDYLTGREQKQSVVGSGVIISEDGYAVTNYHVAGRAERIICTLNDREQVPASLVGGDPATDIAVIKLDLSEYPGKLKAAHLGNSDNLQVGQTVLAMGSPLALSRSVSMGVISTVNRFFPGDIRLPSGEKTGRYNTWLQTDAAINPGNSGGPLVDLDGQNIGFSIPINTVKRVSETLIAHGRVERSWIGIHAQPLQEMEQFFGADGDRGVLVASVDPGSPADNAGIKAGDIILKYGGADVSARFEEELPRFYDLIAESPVGKAVTVEALETGQEKTLTVVPRLLGDLRGSLDHDFQQWGFTATAITTQRAIDERLTDTLGVYVLQAASPGPAYNGGLRRGDVIKKVDNRPVEDLPQLMSLYDSMKDSEKLLLTVDRRGSVRLVLVKVDLTDERNEQPNE